MGHRGEAWVAIQAVLLILYAAVPQTGGAWDSIMAMMLGWSLCITGVGLSVWSALNLGRSLTPLPRPLPDGRLVTHGAYAVVRHPIYTGIILIAVGFALITENWLRLAASAMLFLFFDFKARAEERWLKEKYPDYEVYKAKVKKLIPWIY